VNKTACHEYLVQWVNEDRFFSVVDQQPQLDALLQKLSDTIDTALSQGETELNTADEALDKDLDEVTAHLKNSADFLAKAFEETAQQIPLETEGLLRLAHTIEARILLLYDRVRVRQEKSLNQVRPKNRQWNRIVQSISETLEQGLRDQPEEWTLIRDRQQQNDLSGRSIWQVEGATILEKVCTESPKPLLRLRLARLRFHLKRRYQILEPVLQETFARHRPAILQPDYVPAGGDYAERHEQVSRSCADLWRGLRFNLETAAEECSRLATEASTEEAERTVLLQKLTDTGNLVAETLARTEQQLASIAVPLKELSHQLLEELSGECREMLTLVPKDLQRILSRQERLTYRRQRWMRIWQRRYRLWSDQLRNSLRQTALSLGLVREQVERLRPGEKKGAEKETMLRSIADLPPLEAILEKTEKLPPVPRRLFTCGPLKNREFMVGKNKDLDTLRDLFQRWQGGRLCSIAVTGPDGSGKTSLVNCFQSELGPQLPVLRLHLEKRLTGEQQLLALCKEWFALPDIPEDMRQVEAYLKNMPRTVVILEGLHLLTLRTVGGLDAGRAFLRLVLASRHRLLWVVTSRKYPWQRLEHLLGIGRYFTHMVETQFNSQAEIRDALLLRLQTSGYPVTFLNGNGSEKDDQTGRQERFFADLFSATRGNMQAALFYWMLNLEYDEKEQTLIVKPFEKLDYGSLRSLDRPQLYALAEILAHGGLSAREHAAIFGNTPVQSRTLLDYLTQSNLLQALQEGENDSYYHINPLFFAPLSSLLETRNIIQ
jgi:hypothetical protein